MKFPRLSRFTAVAVVAAVAATGSLALTTTPASALCGDTCGGPKPPPPPAPTATAVNSFAPGYGWAGDAVTIWGGAFSGATQVTFGGLPASFQVVSDSTIAATVPSGVQSGPISVTSPKGTATSTSSFTYSPDLSGSTGLTLPQDSAWQMWASFTIDRSSGYTHVTATGSDYDFWTPFSANTSIVFYDKDGHILETTQAHPMTVLSTAQSWPAPNGSTSQDWWEFVNPAQAPYVHAARIVQVYDPNKQLQNYLNEAVSGAQLIKTFISSVLCPVFGVCV